MVRIFHADTSALKAAGDPAELAARLPAADAERYRRFLHDADRHMFLLGRIMARTLVGRALGCDPHQWRWREGPHGRPEIDDPTVALHFNIAHSADVVVCALADGREVGVDIEDLQRRPVDRSFVTRYCSPAEAADVFAQPDATWHDRFLTYWTLKESYLKARGLGVSVSLSSVSFTLNGSDPQISFAGALTNWDARWQFHLMHLTHRHLLAAAVPMTDGRSTLSVAPYDFNWLSAW